MADRSRKYISIRALTNEELQQQNQQLKDQIAILTQQLDWLKRQLFGRKSEQLNHPDLFAGQPSEKPDSSSDAAAAEEQAPSTAGANPKSEKRTRSIRKDRLPENLPVRTEEIIPEIVQANPQAWRNCGFEEKTQLEKEPAYFYLRRILRMKFVPIDNPFSPPVIEPAKPAMIEGGFWVYRGLTGDVIFDTADPPRTSSCQRLARPRLPRHPSKRRVSSRPSSAPSPRSALTSSRWRKKPTACSAKSRKEPRHEHTFQSPNGATSSQPRATP